MGALIRNSLTLNGISDWKKILFLNHIIFCYSFGFYYVYFSKTYWNCFFVPLTFFRIYSKVKRKYFQSFPISGYNIYSVVHEATAAYTKHIYWRNSVQKFESVSLSSNFVPRLIQMSRIQLWCSFSLFQNRNTLFGQI